MYRLKLLLSLLQCTRNDQTPAVISIVLMLVLNGIGLYYRTDAKRKPNCFNSNIGKIDDAGRASDCGGAKMAYATANKHIGVCIDKLLIVQLVVTTIQE
jgi:hypothetical protein